MAGCERRGGLDVDVSVDLTVLYYRVLRMQPLTYTTRQYFSLLLLIPA